MIELSLCLPSNSRNVGYTIRSVPIGILTTCGSGGTGRRASLRSWLEQSSGGSNPLFRTILRSYAINTSFGWQGCADGPMAGDKMRALLEISNEELFASVHAHAALAIALTAGFYLVMAQQPPAGRARHCRSRCRFSSRAPRRVTARTTAGLLLERRLLPAALATGCRTRRAGRLHAYMSSQAQAPSTPRDRIGNGLWRM